MTAIHFIGIGGAGMSVIADIFASRGWKVSGSDAKESAVTHYLSSLNIRIFIGHDASHVPEEALVVVSSAIRDDNPELVIARSRGQRILHRSQALALSAHGKEFIAVAGAHGKSSTSAMLATIFLGCGKDPSWAIGASVLGHGHGGHNGKGAYFIAEADESDASFLNYSPSIELVTNIEPDHLDHYGSREAFEEAFVEFARRLVPGGTLVACADDEGSRMLARQAHREGIKTYTYGESQAIEGIPHVHIHDVTMSGQESTFICSWLDASGKEGESVAGRIHLPGMHYVRNGAAALTVSVLAGIDGKDAARALEDYHGTGRRFEIKGGARGVQVIDDYAHHPTEIAATLDAARTFVGHGSIHVLFQPHLFSRTRIFAREFAQALDKADDVVICDIYAAREDPAPGVDSSLITRHMLHGEWIPNMHEAARTLATRARSGDIIMTIGAGDVWKADETLLVELKTS